MTLARLIIGGLLALLPIAAVQVAKSSAWGPILSAPLARQQGAPNARVVIVEYSDFQCPSCAFAVPVVHRLMDAYAGRVKLAYKFFPLTKIHKNSMAAAHAAECAADQKQFWPYHDELFSSQAHWAPLTDPTTSFVAIAEQSHLDMARWSACYADPHRTAVIDADIDEGRRREIQATPTFFIGETRLVGGGQLDAEGAQTIERELRR